MARLFPSDWRRSGPPCQCGPRCSDSLPICGKTARGGLRATCQRRLQHCAQWFDQQFAPTLAPHAREPIVSAGADKFLNTNLADILKARNVRTVIVTGTTALGAVLTLQAPRAYVATKSSFRLTPCRQPIRSVSLRQPGSSPTALRGSRRTLPDPLGQNHLVRSAERKLRKLRKRGTNGIINGSLRSLVFAIDHRSSFHSRPRSRKDGAGRNHRISRTGNRLRRLAAHLPCSIGGPVDQDFGVANTHRGASSPEIAALRDHCHTWFQ